MKNYKGNAKQSEERHAYYKTFNRNYNILSEINKNRDSETTQMDNKNLLNKDGMIIDLIYEENNEINIDSTKKIDTKKETYKESTKSDLKQKITNRTLTINTDDDFSEYIYLMIKRDEFEMGYENDCIKYIRAEVKKNKKDVLTAIQKVLLHHSKEKDVWIAVINILTSLSYEEIEPEGVCMVGTFFASKDIEIKELAINIFEQWSNNEAIDFLEEIQTGEKWLDDYIVTVIRDIRIRL
ncbi:MAG: hypothetical protein JJE03_02990 [Peptostreptococcaceae bacterium]|nr:hypothetical protein [Peptostreptococcaceae bacterium]